MTRTTVIPFPAPRLAAADKPAATGNVGQNR
jgi:hypothetical protein